MTGSEIRRMQCVALVGMALLFGLCGCASTRSVSESFVRPAEINMTGRKSVVLEKFTGQDEAAQAAIASRMRQALMSSGFTVVDRDSMDAKAREEFFGDGANADIASAAVLIRGNVLQSNFSKEIEKETRTNKDGGEYYVYRAIGKGSVDVAYDVTDLGTTKLITSATVESLSSDRTSWHTGGAPSIDPNPIMKACYEDNIEKFMKKLAPYRVAVSYNLYPLPEIPGASAGVSLFQAGDPKAAYTEFESALEYARSMPKENKKVYGLLLHNMAIAKEKAGDFDNALKLYVDASQYPGGPNQSDNIRRCTIRRDDVPRLIEQGIISKQ